MGERREEEKEGKKNNKPLNSPVGDPIEDILETSNLDRTVMRLSVQPRGPGDNLSAVQVKDPRLSRDKVTNIIVITRVNPDSQIGLVHGLLDQRNSGSLTTDIEPISTARPRVGVGGSGMDGLLDINTVQVGGGVDIQDTVREGVGDVTGVLVGVLLTLVVDELVSGDSPLVTFI